MKTHILRQSNVDNKSLALAILELCLSEGISTVSQSVEKSAKYIFFKSHNCLMEGFRIDLETFLGLAMLPNYDKENIKLVSR